MNYKEVKEIEERVNPDLFVTLTVKQAIATSGCAFVYGSPEVYDRVVKSIYNILGKRFYGKRSWRRKARFISNITTVERGRDGRWHVHACIRKPSHVTIEQFKDAFHSVWSRSEWHMRRYEIEDYRGGGVSYILKDGQDAILVGASHF